MRAVPLNKIDRINFYRNHLVQWAANAVAIGVPAAEVTALQALVATAEADYAAQQLALQAGKDAVATCTLSVERMNRKGMEIIKQVRAKATTSGDAVYPLAGLPVPPIPSAVPMPGTPTDLVVALDGNGALRLKWSCKNPAGSSGLMYQIYRRIDGAIGAGELAYLGGSGMKSFTDTTVPAGATQITYQMHAVRSTGVGLWATFTVSFGSNVPVATPAGVGANPIALKIAA